jgi:hypothetical protein
MDDTIISTYYLCEEFLSPRGYRHDPQARISTAEVMTTALVAAALFGGNIERTPSFLEEYGYMPTRRSPRAASTGGSTP